MQVVAQAAGNTKKELGSSESDIARKTDGDEVNTDEFLNIEITAKSAPETPLLEPKTAGVIAEAAAEVPQALLPRLRALLPRLIHLLLRIKGVWLSGLIARSFVTFNVLLKG